MSELHFRLTLSDAGEFLEWFFESFHPTFIPGENSSKDFPEYRIATDVIEVVHRRLAEGLPARFFAISEAWSLTPLCVGECHPADGRPSFFFLRQRYGGPAFDILFRRELGGGVGEDVCTGWLMDYPYYFRQLGSSESIERPLRMSEAFKATKAWIRRKQVVKKAIG